MKNRYSSILVILVIMACGPDQGGSESQITVPVSVEEVKKKPIEEYLSASGTVNAAKQVTLKAESEGYYHLLKNPRRNQPFAMGDRVLANETIIRLENPELENTVRLESQRLNLDISQREFEKQQSLYEKGGVTLRELKNAEKTYIDAKYAYENAVLSLQKLNIKAPFEGIIVDLPYYTEKTLVAAGSAMAQIMDYSRLYMEIQLPGKELTRIQVGQPARVMYYALPQDTLQGQITQVSPALNPDTRSFKASLEIHNPRLLLRPGMFVKAEIILTRKDSAIVIPKDIILSRQRGKTVFVVERGAAEERVITTGIENPDAVEVVEGLKPGERMVIKGFETLQNRSKVKIVR